MDSTTGTPAEGEIFFTSSNAEKPVTIVLLHGALTNHLEWDAVAPHLANFHLLIPDLPQHSFSKDIRPFSIPFAAEKTASLIEKHAHEGRAHLVGMSLGGYVAMEVIRRHPGLVASAFVSGAAPVSGLRLRQLEWSSMAYYSQLGLIRSPYNLFLRLGRWWLGLRMSDSLMAALGPNYTWELFEAVVNGLKEWQENAVTETGKGDVRILVVSGGKQDDTEAIKKLGQKLRSLGTGEGRLSRAAVVKTAVHPWNMQLPELFANGIISWIGQSSLPPEFEILDQEDGAK
ncbi:alpha/beta-hydrolase [Thozetella sp. PMI_491]|nr:alpha/beta-hydrolase [Thozetella sp. PMI_491]